jgi:tRNA(fMet)-specific endonuclease VapC
MRRILLDTNAYVAFKRGEPGAREIVQIADTLGLSTVVLGELLGGFALGTRAVRNRTELGAFLESPRVAVLPVSEATAEFYASVFAALRRKGQPIPTNDLWVAATALEHGFALFTYDGHFRSVDGLLAGSRPDDFLP